MFNCTKAKSTQNCNGILRLYIFFWTLRFYLDYLGYYQTLSDDEISTFNVLLYFLFNIFQVEFGLSVCGISRTDSSVFPGGDDSRNICLPNAFWLVLYFDLFFFYMFCLLLLFICFYLSTF